MLLRRAYSPLDDQCFIMVQSPLGPKRPSTCTLFTFSWLHDTGPEFGTNKAVLQLRDTELKHTSQDNSAEHCSGVGACGRLPSLLIGLEKTHDGEGLAFSFGTFYGSLSTSSEPFLISCASTHIHLQVAAKAKGCAETATAKNSTLQMCFARKLQKGDAGATRTASECQFFSVFLDRHLASLPEALCRLISVSISCSTSIFSSPHLFLILLSFCLPLSIFLRRCLSFFLSLSLSISLRLSLSL